jgi:hypothetical protein
MDTYLVAYDVCDPKRLRKVAKICEDGEDSIRCFLPIGHVGSGKIKKALV